METTRRLSESIKRYGLTQIYPPARSTLEASALVDVVFVHGLDGHPYHTWTSDVTQTFWPGQLLPPILKEEKARILVYGYNADVTPVADGVSSKDKIHNHAERLVAELWANRSQQKATERPIIFVAHSLGGLVVKRALVHSSGIRGNNTAHLRSICVSTHAILFFGTPHKGFDIETWISRWEPKPGSVESPQNIHFPPQIIHSLGIKNETLENLDRQFIQLCNKIRIYFFYEGKPTSIHGSWYYVVEEESAAPIIQDVEYTSFQQDHTHMCRFENEISPGYEIVTEAIQRYAAEVPKQIQAHWRSERAEGKVRIDAQIRELSGDDIKLVDKAVDTPGGGGSEPPSSSGRLGSKTCLKPLPKRYYIVPRERVKHFVGRDAQLGQISSHFATGPGNRPQVLILHALGGQGKSQIAIEYCQLSREQYAGIFWVNANSEDLAVQSYARVAAALSGSSLSEIVDGYTAVKTVADYLEAWDQRWLLVFDNYDKPEEFPNVQKFLPEFGHGHIIFTSRRNQDLDRLGSLLEIPAMNVDEGVSLLLRGHSDQDIKQHLTIASQIVDRLGGLPLAIDQAAAYIRYQRLPLDQLGEFLTIYELKRKEILSHIPPRFWEYGKMQIHGKEEQKKALNAFTTWELSLEQLTTDDSLPSDEMTHVLTLFAFLSSTRIEEWLFRHHSERDHRIEDCAVWEHLFSAPEEESNDASRDSLDQAIDHGSYLESDDNLDQGSHDALNLESNDKIDDEKYDDHHNSSLTDLESDASSLGRSCECRWSSVKFWDMLSKFDDLSLIQTLERHSDEAVFSLHPLIRDWLQLREEEDSRQRMIEESVAVVVASVRLNDPQTMSLERKTSLLAHVDACVLNDECFTEEHQLGHDIQNCGNAHLLARFYVDQGRYEAAEKLLSIVSATQTKSLGEEHVDTLMTMATYGILLYYQGKADEAERIERQTVQLRKRILGEEDASTLHSLELLALTLLRQCKYNEAESLQRKMLQKLENHFGKRNSDTIRCSAHLAETLFAQGRWSEAEKMQREALQLGETLLGRQNETTVDIMAELVQTLNEQRKVEEAEKLGREVLQWRERSYGKQHLNTLLTMQSLAVTQFLRGRDEEAVKLCRDALELHLEVFGKNHPNTLVTMHDLAWMLSHNESTHNEAVQLCRRTLVLRKEVLGREHRDTLSIMNLLGWILSQQESSYHEAEQILREAYQLWKRVLGSEHRETVRTMRDLAKVLQRQGKCDDVEETTHQISEVGKALDDSFSIESSGEIAPLPSQVEISSKKKRWRFTIRRHHKKGYNDSHAT